MEYLFVRFCPKFKNTKFQHLDTIVVYQPPPHWLNRENTPTVGHHCGSHDAAHVQCEHVNIKTPISTQGPQYRHICGQRWARCVYLGQSLLFLSGVSAEGDPKLRHRGFSAESDTPDQGCLCDNGTPQSCHHPGMNFLWAGLHQTMFFFALKQRKHSWLSQNNVESSS